MHVWLIIFPAAYQGIPLTAVRGTFKKKKKWLWILWGAAPAGRRASRLALHIPASSVINESVIPLKGLAQQRGQVGLCFVDLKRLCRRKCSVLQWGSGLVLENMSWFAGESGHVNFQNEAKRRRDAARWHTRKQHCDIQHLCFRSTSVAQTTPRSLYGQDAITVSVILRSNSYIVAFWVPWPWNLTLSSLQSATFFPDCFCSLDNPQIGSGCRLVSIELYWIL